MPKEPSLILNGAGIQADRHHHGHLLHAEYHGNLDLGGQHCPHHRRRSQVHREEVQGVPPRRVHVETRVRGWPLHHLLARHSES